MKLPKLNRVVEIQFSSLRNSLGEGMGVIFDVDTIVSRYCRRILCEGGWKWQIADALALSEFDWFIETDEEILNEIGSDTSLVEIKLHA